MQRTVFSTAIKAQGASGDGQSSSALEVGHDNENRTILFRERGGEIFDITASTTVTPTPNITDAFDLSMTLPKDVADSPLVGFSIRVTKLTVQDQAAFTGTLSRHQGAEADQITTFAWEGTFSAFRDTPISVIREGLKPIPERVKTFLELSPISGPQHEDVAMNQAQRALKNLLVVNLDSWARDRFFHHREGNLPSFPSQWGHVPSVFQLSSISTDNSIFLHELGLRLVCRGLKNAKWFAKAYRDRVKDKVDEYLVHIRPGEDNGLTDSYKDSATRAHLSSFLTAREEPWQKLLVGQSVAEFWHEVVATLKAPNFKEHWIPKNLLFAEAKPGNPRIPLEAKLVELRNKLLILKAWTEDARKMAEDDKDIEEMVNDLAHEAQTTGLIGSGKVVIDPKMADLKFEIGEIFSEGLKLRMAMGSFYAGLGAFFAPSTIDRQSAAVCEWLVKEAQPMGLYD